MVKIQSIKKVKKNYARPKMSKFNAWEKKHWRDEYLYSNRDCSCSFCFESKIKIKNCPCKKCRGCHVHLGEKHVFEVYKYGYCEDCYKMGNKT